MMKFSFISLFPGLIDSCLNDGVVAQAIKKKLISYEVINPRTFCNDIHRSVDDVSYGGIDGMVMLAEVLQKALEYNFSQGAGDGKKKIYFLSPQGKTFKQDQISKLLEYREIVFICGRYAGVDNRFLIHNNIEEISIGDFVLSGGELPGLVIMDAVSRQIPGVLGNKESATQDSFANSLLEAPCFTRPQIWQGLEVPKVLLSGHHKNIEEWKEKISVLVTLKKRPEMLSAKSVSMFELKKFYDQIPEKEKIVCGIQDMVFQLND